MGTLPVSATPSGVVDVGFDVALGMSRVELRASHKAKTEHLFSSLGVQERVGRYVNCTPPAGHSAEEVPRGNLPALTQCPWSRPKDTQLVNPKMGLHTGDGRLVYGVVCSPVMPNQPLTPPCQFCKALWLAS